MDKMLFPHWVQRVSLAVFILDYIAMMVFIFRSVYNDMATSKALELGLLIVLFISIFCQASCPGEGTGPYGSGAFVQAKSNAAAARNAVSPFIRRIL